MSEKDKFISKSILAEKENQYHYLYDIFFKLIIITSPETVMKISDHIIKFSIVMYKTLMLQNIIQAFYVSKCFATRQHKDKICF
jgi:hypothetical protein